MAKLTKKKHIEIEHQLSAHCETGCMAELLNYSGLKISEPMVFGICGLLFFGYFKGPKTPFPIFVMRLQPGAVHKNLSKYLGIKFQTKTFKDPDKAEKELDELVESGVPVVVQVDFFYMDYIPQFARAHFNGHYIIVIGTRGDNYIVSDPYHPSFVEVPKKSVRKGRFARGEFSPKGFMLWNPVIPEKIDMKTGIKKGLKNVLFYNTKVPIPFMGYKGIKYFAREVKSWPALTRDLDHLSHEIMNINIVLEDRGTGGAGFRYMFATFLQEASVLFENDILKEQSKKWMDNGDEWRKVSLHVARIGRNRELGPEKLEELAELISSRSPAEQELFNEIKTILKSL